MSADAFAAPAVEGGDAGGGSARQAAERRSIIARLEREAAWLESVSADQRLTARLLATLPDDFSVLHDLQWADADAAPGADGKRPAPHMLDHLVAGPGGLFAVVTRRFAVAIQSRDDELWVGDVALADELGAVLRAAQSLANALGIAVAPVMGFHGDTLPSDAPAALQGVLLCPAAEVAVVIERFPHTMMLPHERASVIEQLAPLMIAPGTSTRHQQPAPTPAPSAAPARERADDEPRPARTARPEPAADDEFELVDDLAEVPAPTRDRHGLKVLVVLLLVAAVIGAGLWWFLDAGDDSSGSSAVDAAPASTDAPAGDTNATGADAGTGSGDLAVSIPAPALSVSLVCPAKGDGWQIVPDWPGDVVDLSSYDIEIQGDDGTWTHLTLLESKDLSVAALSAQPPRVTFEMRATAVMLDMSRAEGTATEVTTPDEAC